MSTPTDKTLSGTPTDVPPIHLDQLPYNTQPVPFHDLTGYTESPRGLSYPDDVIPTLSNLNAMDHTNPRVAQTLHSDGNHALLVKDVSTGGGTGGSGGAHGVPTGTVTLFNFSGFGELHEPAPNCNVLYAAHGYIHSWQDTVRTTQVMTVDLYDLTTLQSYVLGTVAADYSAMTVMPPDVLIPINLSFPNGLDLRQAMNWSGNCEVRTAGAPSFWGALSLDVIYGDV